MADKTTPPPPAAEIVITYRGENGEGWVPKSMRDVWNYAVRTGQVVVPSLDDGGPLPDEFSIDTGDQIAVGWVPPEYAGRLKEVAPPPQPTYFALEGDT